MGAVLVSCIGAEHEVDVIYDYNHIIINTIPIIISIRIFTLERKTITITS